MLRHVIAQQTLLQLQGISADCSDGEYSDSELDDALTNDAQAELDSNGEELDVGSPSEVDNSDLQNQVQMNQVLIGKKGTAWQALVISQVQRGHLQRKNILSFKPGPTIFATSRITESSPLSLFRVLFDEVMLKNIRKCIVAEAHSVSGRMNWDMTLDDLDKFIGLVIARGILGQRGLPVESLWDTTWGCSMFNKTLSRCRFKEIMRFLRFDVKSERRQRVILDKFCLVSSLWKPFIENSQKAYVPSP